METVLPSPDCLDSRSSGLVNNPSLYARLVPWRVASIAYILDLELEIASETWVCLLHGGLTEWRTVLRII